MTTSTVIKVDNLSKSYDVYKKPQDLLWEFFTGKVNHDVFWALRNVSFNIYEKQRIGIIGPNGAGKSTLLKILTGNLTPTSGQVEINGKVSALLSMASSLNPEESGMENIKFNLLLNGVPQKKIPTLVDDIVEFAEIGSFIYSPVKTYSSGMNARLSFGIATAMEPEILVVDEVLAVGDGYFLGKAYERMMKLVDRGKALIFVSHSVAEVRKLCNTALWLEKGTVRMIGEAGYVCTQYEEDYQNNQTIQQKEKNKVKYLGYARDGVNAEHLDSHNCLVRIVPDNDTKSYKDVHYVRSVSIKTEDMPSKVINLEPDHSDQNTCKLDLLGSEWGRVYYRNGVLTRALSYQTGKMRGGILLCNVDDYGDSSAEVSCGVSFETASISSNEILGLDYFDLNTQSWVSSNCSYQDLSDGWRRYTGTFKLPVINNQQIKNIIDTYRQDRVKSAELTAACVKIDSKRSQVVIERQPFQIEIEFKVNEKIDVLDVHLLVYRSDGVYVFWQPSGLNNTQIANAYGEYIATFFFDPNLFGAGQYYVNAYLKDKWELSKHYNDYEIFDSVLHLCDFQILKEYDIEMIDFGVVNTRVNVTISPK